jgi:hypothetical protein
MLTRTTCFMDGPRQPSATPTPPPGFALLRLPLAPTCTLEDFGHIGHVQAQRERPVAAEVLEAISAQRQRHQAHMAGVHGLRGGGGVAMGGRAGGGG